jgi:hypothetical protein
LDAALDLDTFRVTLDQGQLKQPRGAQVSPGLWTRVRFTEVLWSYWLDNNGVTKTRRRVEFKAQLGAPKSAVAAAAASASQARTQVSTRFWYLPETIPSAEKFNRELLVAEFY